MSHNPIPTNAIKISYKYGKSSGYFHVWSTKSGKWQWQCLGNNGEEATKESAISAARAWVIDSGPRKSV